MCIHIASARREQNTTRHSADDGPIERRFRGDLLFSVLIQESKRDY